LLLLNPSVDVTAIVETSTTSQQDSYSSNGGGGGNVLLFNGSSSSAAATAADQNSSSTYFDFHSYQKALLKRNQTLAEGFRRIFHISTSTTTTRP
jgi:hypothetical protein